MVPKLVDTLLTLITGTLASAACAAAADLLDPVGAEARADLTDARIAEFLDGAEAEEAGESRES